MRKISVILVFLFLSLSVFANESLIPSPEPAVKANLAKKSLLLGITKINEAKLIAVGEHGHILLSTDGVQWQQADVPVQTTLTSVFFLDEKLGWAVGHDATILHSSDGGQSWQIQHYNPSLQKPFFDVVFKDENEGIAIGAYGQMFRTVNGGQTWKSEFHNEFLLPDDVEYLAELKSEDEEAYLDEIAFILPHFNRVFKDGRTLFLLGEVGLIAKSNDFGKTWQQFNEIYQGSFFDLGRTKAGNLLVVGLRGHVFRGIKNGTQWSEVNSSTTALLNDVVVNEVGRIFILGNNGTLLESEDDGVTYKNRTQKDGKALIAGVWFNEKLIAVSEVGIKIINVLP